MNNSSDQNYRQTVALAGVFQAATLVKSAAWKGRQDSHAHSALFRSIFKIDADSIEDIYGDLSHLNSGLRVLSEHLGAAASKRDFEIARYSAQILALQRKLMRNKTALGAISQGIADADQQLENFGLQHANTVARLAEIYTSNISNITPRIMVNGEPMHLTDSNTAACIRALLLAGIRSAFLWRQSGGSRWLILLKRKQYAHWAHALLELHEEGDRE